MSDTGPSASTTSEFGQTDAAEEEVVLKAPLWAVGGGKGGVGKSLTSLNLSTYLSMMGRQVVVIDGDLGGADMHTLLGMPPPKRSLASFLNREVDTLDEALVDTVVPRLKLLAGASDIVGIANPRYTQQTRLVRHLTNLPADELILDLGAGTSFAVLDLFSAAQRKVVVLTPDPTAIQDTYAFLKMALHRLIKRRFASRAKHQDPIVRDRILEAIQGKSGKRAASMKTIVARVAEVSESTADELEEFVDNFRVWIVLNMATPHEGKSTATALARVAWDFLSLNVQHAGTVGRDEELAKSVRRMRPFLLDNRDGVRWREFGVVAASVLRGHRGNKKSEAESAGATPPPLPGGPTAASPPPPLTPDQERASLSDASLSAMGGAAPPPLPGAQPSEDAGSTMVGVAPPPLEDAKKAEPVAQPSSDASGTMPGVAPPPPPEAEAEAAPSAEVEVEVPAPPQQEGVNRTPPPVVEPASDDEF